MTTGHPGPSSDPVLDRDLGLGSLPSSVNAVIMVTDCCWLPWCIDVASPVGASVFSDNTGRVVVFSGR